MSAIFRGTKIFSIVDTAKSLSQSARQKLHV